MDLVDDKALRKRAEIAASRYLDAAEKVLIDTSNSKNLDTLERLDKIDKEKSQELFVSRSSLKADKHPPTEEKYGTLNRRAIQALKMISVSEVKEETATVKKLADISQVLEEFQLQTEGGIALMKNSPMKEYLDESEAIYLEIAKSIRKLEESVLKSGKPMSIEMESKINSLKHKARDILSNVHYDFLKLEEIRVYIQHLLLKIGKTLQPKTVSST